jgi:L-asparaginase / beta-aspartyl-peptidase
MNYIIRLCIVVSLCLLLFSCKNSANKRVNNWAIALHGGAGNLLPQDFSDDEIALHKKELSTALDLGIEILKNGGSSLYAVEQVVRYLEDCPLFNAGRGAVFTHDGKNELDAAIMEGKELRAGAVAGIGNIKNPISAARLVMEKSPHVLMVGKGASLFASQNGADVVDSAYFFTQKSWNALQRALNPNDKMGTVGCVALDIHGNLAAATSTGGMTNKRYGRVGDVPIIGAGTYANNSTCAVSATGHGEFFIRYTVAHDISALMEYKGLSLMQAAHEVVNNKLVVAGGKGGIIAVDKVGNVCMTFNSAGMFRAFATEMGEKEVAIFE